MSSHRWRIKSYYRVYRSLIIVAPLLFPMPFIAYSQAATQAGRADEYIQRLKDRDPEVRANAAKSLGRIEEDPRAVEPLIALLLRDQHPKVRESAAFALGEIKDARAVEPLMATLKDTNALVRDHAAIALGKIKDARAVKPLIAALKDDSEGVRASVADALGEIEDPRAVEPLISALRDDGDLVRIDAARSLGWIKDARAVEPLIAMLKNDKIVNVTFSAARALGEIKATRAVEPLIALLRDESSTVRSEAILALDMIGGKRAEEALKLLSRSIDLNRIVRDYASLIDTEEGRRMRPFFVLALLRHGSRDMAQAFLNSGNYLLEETATIWAARNGIDVHYISR